MDINKIIKEEYNNIITEDINKEYKYFSIDFDNENEELDDLDLDIYDLSDQADEIAKNSNIGILRNKELTGIILNLDTLTVAGALWVNNDLDEFSFDIAIDQKYRNKGLSYILIDQAMNEYEYRNDIVEDEKLPIKIEAINPIMVNILKNKYGFKEVEKIKNYGSIMTK